MAKTDSPVLILHGWKVTGDRYTPLKTLLEQKGYKVFVPDMPGNGKAPDPEKPYTLENYVQFVKKYCAESKISGAQIVGHSFGGRVGIKLATDEPELVQKLILTGVPGIRAKGTLKRILFLFASKLSKNVFGDFAVLKKFLYRLAGSYDYTKTSGVMRETFKNIISSDLVEPMKMLSVPTILVWGENDKLVPLKIAAKMQKLIKHSRLKTVEGSGHGVPYQQPELFITESGL